jgi:hypothetical protein
MHIFPVPFSAIHLMLEKAGNSAPNGVWHRKVGGHLHVGDFVEFEEVCFPSADVRKNILTADHYMHFTCGKILHILPRDSEGVCQFVLIQLSLANYISISFYCRDTITFASLEDQLCLCTWNQVSERYC